VGIVLRLARFALPACWSHDTAFTIRFGHLGL
jgi:hypothetical protein